MSEKETIKQLEDKAKKIGDPKIKEAIIKKINILKSGKPVEK